MGDEQRAMRFPTAVPPLSGTSRPPGSGPVTPAATSGRAGRVGTVSLAGPPGEIQNSDYARRSRHGNVTGRGFESRRLQL